MKDRLKMNQKNCGSKGMQLGASKYAQSIQNIICERRFRKKQDIILYRATFLNLKNNTIHELHTLGISNVCIQLEKSLIIVVF